MSFRRFAASLIALAFVLSAAAQVKPPASADPVLKKIIEIGKSDNRVMTWLDYASNRFGGRYTGTDAYANASAWALWQFKQFGVQAELDEAGEVPVGFNRGPWFGKMIKPVEKTLYFGTPTMTAGTKGLQRGPAAPAPNRPPAMPPMGPGGQRPEQPPIGKIVEISGGAAYALVAADVQKSAAGLPFPKALNPALKHSAAGILGLSYENRFYLTLKAKPDFDSKFPAIGKVIAGADVLKKLAKEDAVRGVRIIRVGQAAKDFKTDDDSYRKLVEKAAEPRR